MEGFEQTPPEGLWEAIAAGLPARKVAFPWVWALAGVAAVALAVVLLWKPQQPITSPAIAESEPVEIVEPVAEEEPATEEDFAPAPVVAAPARASRSLAQTRPAANEDSVPEDDSDVMRMPEEEAPTVIAAESEPVSPDQKIQEPETEEAQPAAPMVPEITTIPETMPRQTRFSNSRLTASLVAGSLPGGVTNTTTGYGTAPGRHSVKAAPASLLSRNKPSQTDTHHSVALRVGALFNLSFTEHWGIETGLQLTNLQTQTRTVTGNITNTKDKTISYIGIPLMVVYTPLRFDRFSVYTSAGPMFEYGFRSHCKDESYIGTELSDRNTYDNRESDVIFSVGLNLGAQYQISSVGALFLQPGLSWHLVGEGNTETFYTEHPLSFGITAGFRFGF